MPISAASSWVSLAFRCFIWFVIGGLLVQENELVFNVQATQNESQLFAIRCVDDALVEASGDNMPTSGAGVLCGDCHDSLVSLSCLSRLYNVVLVVSIDIFI